MSIDFRARDILQPGPLWRAWRLVARTERLDGEALRTWQGQRLEALTAEAVEQVPYLRDTLARLGLRPGDFRYPPTLRQLPLLDTATLRADLQRHLPADLTRWDASWHPTRGTAQPLPLSREMRTLELASRLRQWSWLGYRPWHCMAQLDGNFWLRQPQLAQRLTVYSPATNSLHINPFRLSTETAPAIAAALRLRRVRYLHGIAGAVHALALAFGRAGVSHALRAVFPTGETLPPKLKERVRLSLSAQVVDAYGQTECVARIAQCNAGSYHVLEHYGVTELVPDPPGDPRQPRTARVIGSTLHNAALPLLRFDTGDRVERVPDGAHPCPCGRRYPVVQAMRGATPRVVITADGRRIAHSFLLAQAVPAVARLQVRQAADGALTLAVVPGEGWDEGQAARLRRLAEQVYGTAQPLNLQTVGGADLERDESGRVPGVVSALPPADLLG